MNTIISPNEAETLETYRSIAGRTARTDFNPEYWRSDFEIFRRLLPTGRIIDLACGEGRDARFFIETGYQYVGIDACDEMISVAKTYEPGADFRKMNMHDLDFPPGYFDGFWAVSCLFHIPKAGIRDVLEGIRRVVARSGIGFIVLKHGSAETMVPGPEGKKRLFAFYDDQEFSSILAESGFEMLKEASDTRENWSKEQVRWLKYLVRIK